MPSSYRSLRPLGRLIYFAYTFCIRRGEAKRLKKVKNVEMTESKIPISTCRPQGATLCKVRFLKHTEIRPIDDISYVIKKTPLCEPNCKIALARYGVFLI